MTYYGSTNLGANKNVNIGAFNCNTIQIIHFDLTTKFQPLKKLSSRFPASRSRGVGVLFSIPEVFVNERQSEILSTQKRDDRL